MNDKNSNDTFDWDAFSQQVDRISQSTETSVNVMTNHLLHDEENIKKTTDNKEIAAGIEIAEAANKTKKRERIPEDLFKKPEGKVENLINFFEKSSFPRITDTKDNGR